MSPVKFQHDNTLNSLLPAAGSPANPVRSATNPGGRSRVLGHLSDFLNMNVVAADFKSQTVRLLVAIASFGEKNVGFLKRIIRTYQAMPMAVDVVVFSDQTKDLGPDVKVVVGLPSKNPWSLPFAHKDYFARNIDRYDLFIYSEDDMEVTEGNINAFLRVTPELKPDEIAGFLRYEMDKSGNRSLPEVHGTSHWKPDSVGRRGGHTIAGFSNEHAAFYLLTQNQLRRAIASRGFLREPCEGRYDMLCTVATDPYTNCGLRKVICVSALEDFLIHHLPNRYAGQLGIPLASFKEQVQTIMAIDAGTHPISNLCETESRLQHGKWSKSYYEKPCKELMEMLPRDGGTILSVGCGWGTTEADWKQSGARVTVMPLDSVVGAAVERRGVEVVYGTWNECLKILGDRQFDCVYMKDLLHLQAHPGQFVQQCARLVGSGGTLVLAGPNFNRVPWLVKRVLGIGEFRKLRSFDLSGISICGPKTLTGHLTKAGLHTTVTQWLNHGIGRGRSSGIRFPLGRFTAKDWVLRARRNC